MPTAHTNSNLYCTVWLMKNPQQSKYHQKNSIWLLQPCTHPNLTGDFLRSAKLHIRRRLPHNSWDQKLRCTKLNVPRTLETNRVPSTAENASVWQTIWVRLKSSLHLSFCPSSFLGLALPYILFMYMYIYWYNMYVYLYTCIHYSGVDAWVWQVPSAHLQRQCHRKCASQPEGRLRAAGLIVSSSPDLTPILTPTSAKQLCLASALPKNARNSSSVLKFFLSEEKNANHASLWKVFCSQLDVHIHIHLHICVCICRQQGRLLAGKSMCRPNQVDCHVQIAPTWTVSPLDTPWKYTVYIATRAMPLRISSPTTFAAPAGTFATSKASFCRKHFAGTPEAWQVQ